jgi:hypothetical protein
MFMDGELDGTQLGIEEGALEAEGARVGDLEGEAVGLDVGDELGLVVGWDEGLEDG